MGCAYRWEAELRRYGIADLNAADLAQEAWRRSQRAYASGELQNPAAFMCTVIERLTLVRLRQRRTRGDYTVDPLGGEFATVAAGDPWLDDLLTRLELDATLGYLERYRAEIWTDAIEALGPTARVDSLWAAARRAVGHLLIKDTGWNIDETLDASMRASDSWFGEDRQPGDTSEVAAESIQRRRARYRPWVSFVTLVEGLPWARRNPRETAALFRHHLRHLPILVRGARTDEQRERVERHIADMKRHIADIQRRLGEPLQDETPDA